MRTALLAIWLLTSPAPGETQDDAVPQEELPVAAAEEAPSYEGVEALFERMGYMEREEREATREWLVEQHGETMVPLLIAGLGADSYHVRRESARTLHEFAEHAEPAIPALIQLMTDHDEDGDVAGWARRTLVAIGEPAVPALTEALKHPSHRARYRAAYALGSLRGVAAPATPALIEALDDESGDVRHRATSALKHQALHDPEPLLDAIDSDSLAIRFGVARALTAVPEHHDLALSVFVEFLADDDPRWRRSAVFALGERDAPAGAALDEMLELLDDPDVEVRRRLPHALIGHGGTTPEAIRRLAQRLTEEPDPVVRQRIADALSRAHARAAPAREVLLATLREEDPHLRYAAARALFHIGREADVARIVAVLAALLEQDQMSWHPPALRLLGRMGDEAEAALPAIRDAMEHEWADVRRAAVAAVVEVERDATALVQDLITALDDPDYIVRMGAISGLSRLGTEAVDAVPALKRIQQEDRHPRLRTLAGSALEQITWPNQ